MDSLATLVTGSTLLKNLLSLVSITTRVSFPWSFGDMKWSMTVVLSSSILNATSLATSLKTLPTLQFAAMRMLPLHRNH